MGFHACVYFFMMDKKKIEEWARISPNTLKIISGNDAVFFKKVNKDNGLSNDNNEMSME